MYGTHSWWQRRTCCFQREDQDTERKEREGPMQQPTEKRSNVLPGMAFLLQ